MWNDAGSSDAIKQTPEIKDGTQKSVKIDNKIYEEPKEEPNIKPLFGNLGLKGYGSADIKPKEEVKPQAPTVDTKPKVLHEVGSSHKYAIPSKTFTDKTVAAEGKFLNINVCDPDGHTFVFKVWNKAPIQESIMQRYGKMVNYDVRELRFTVDGQRVYSIHCDGTWYTPVDLEWVDGDSVDIFKQQDGGSEPETL